jgi:hypothetical protein
MTTHVYVLVDAIGTKIGISKAPDARAKDLQGRLVKYWFIDGCARDVERTAHAILGNPIHKREWFGVSEAEAIDAVKQAIKRCRKGDPVRSKFQILREKRERPAKAFVVHMEQVNQWAEEANKIAAACAHEFTPHPSLAQYICCSKCGTWEYKLAN